MIREFIKSREALKPLSASETFRKAEGEGGCGVIGLASSVPIKGKHLLKALRQMCNRGNGKGGGIAAVGLSAKTFGVSQKVLENDYLLTIAYLDKKWQSEVEKRFIYSIFDVDHVYQMPHIADYRILKGLDVKPPEAVAYFIRVKEEVVKVFREKNNLKNTLRHKVEDEIVYQNSFKLNSAFYASEGEKKAFVLSHGKNMLVLKMVGFGDDVIVYYELENFSAHVWIGHHRYPTKGTVWHPGGAHPFVGLNEALVHNGDFANYFSICEYLAQRNIHPHFLTDTEVSALLFDLLHRTYQYPLEYVIEALAPTTERDFTLLPEAKQQIYQLLQKTHMHGSPDGPWFFLIAQSEATDKRAYRLIGITDTSMLRPQVFALQKGEAAIGLAASEKQAIDATLKSLSEEDGRFWPRADYYWNARGGSYTDGGAFIFSVYPNSDGRSELVATDKFGNVIHGETLFSSHNYAEVKKYAPMDLPDLPAHEFYNWLQGNIILWDYSQAQHFLESLVKKTLKDQNHKFAFDILTRLMDRHYHLKHMRRSCFLSLVDKSFNDLVETLRDRSSPLYAFHSSGRNTPEAQSKTLVIDARRFAPDGPDSLAVEIIKMYKSGFKSFLIVNCQGHRFIANGLGPATTGIRIDIYGSSGDYLSSGIDGASVHVHGSGQDQLAQIMKSGSLIVHGDVGQTFMYGAKGGKAFILGNAAGRPMINSVGSPKVVINGTCLDYLAESFMAGNPLNGGGFVLINGLKFNEEGSIEELDMPYPGGNLFSLASGGAIYIRDPGHKITYSQLNGGQFLDIIQHDKELIMPILNENAHHFDIPVERLLTHERKLLEFHQIYRKIAPASVRVLQEEEAWVKKL